MSCTSKMSCVLSPHEVQDHVALWRVCAFNRSIDRSLARTLFNAKTEWECVRFHWYHLQQHFVSRFFCSILSNRTLVWCFTSCIHQNQTGFSFSFFSKFRLNVILSHIHSRQVHLVNGRYLWLNFRLMAKHSPVGILLFFFRKSF